ncbi:WhiB family transcriptional regulator [Streptomyces clavifer]|uniref:WhiB family transcriptional regulator n=1 Tax=Streptomyces clavifer TaxID=68188 RepID=UPI0030937B5D|nr:WhiB family transcriptional regulator [Streptomyces clavifer]
MTTSLFHLVSHGQQAPNTLEPASPWQRHALCADPVFDPEDWFPIGEGATAQQQTEDAKAVCRACPVMETCLQWAMEHGQDTGVWGGLSEKERRSMHRRHVRAARRVAG